jgi:hypothetical protein
MFPRPSSSCPPHRRTPTAVRILALLALSALLHLLAIDWAGGGLQLPRWRAAEAPPVQVELRPAPEPAVVPPPPPKPRPQPKPKPKARPPRPAPKTVAQPPAPEAPPSPEPAPAVEASPQPDAAPGASDESAAPVAASTAEPPAAESAAPSAPEPPRHVFGMPPSAELKYEVQALREGKIVYGHGKIAWRSDGGSYLVEGDAGVLFFTLLEFSSRGMVDENGVAPVQYAEKRFRRPETATHFRRDAGLISFSASTVTYPRRGGEQDRASIVWQLAAIGRGEPERFQAGAGFDIFVAGVRDGETWTMQVLGLEDIDTGAGRLKAWHVVRVPRPGSYEQKLDIWLAPGRDWYPMRLRWTETNGDYLDMSASGVTPLSTMSSLPPPR